MACRARASLLKSPPPEGRWDDLKPPTLLFRGQKETEFLKGRIILDKAKRGLVGANNVVTEALALAFFTKIIFRKGVSADAKRPHGQFAVFHFGIEIIGLLLGGGLFYILLGHGVSSPEAVKN
jgi:hypothetical protein